MCEIPGKETVKLLCLLCAEDDAKTRTAASGALAILTSESEKLAKRVRDCVSMLPHFVRLDHGRYLDRGKFPLCACSSSTSRYPYLKNDLKKSQNSKITAQARVQVMRFIIFLFKNTINCVQINAPEKSPLMSLDTLAFF